MKKKRTIIIKDPQLQKIRNNLRMLLIKWGSKTWNHLFDECDRIEHNEHRKIKHLHELTNEEKRQIDTIRREMKEIRSAIDNSICICTRCSAPDKDMFFNPVKKEWFCVNCAKELHEYYKSKKEAFFFPPVFL